MADLRWGDKVAAKLSAEAAEKEAKRIRAVTKKIEESLAKARPINEQRLLKKQNLANAKMAERRLETVCNLLDDSLKDRAPLKEKAKKKTNQAKDLNRRYKMACIELEKVFERHQRLKRELDAAGDMALEINKSIDPAHIEQLKISVMGALEEVNVLWEKVQKSIRKSERNRPLKKRAGNLLK